MGFAVSLVKKQLEVTACQTVQFIDYDLRIVTWAQRMAANTLPETSQFGNFISG